MKTQSIQWGKVAGLAGTIDRPDGTRLAWRLAVPEGGAKGLVVLAHGVGEHLGRYGHVAERLVAAGYAVTGADHRGHGDSSGARVFVRAFSEYTGDLEAARAAGRERVAEGPVIVLGHSMGGLIAATHAVDYPNSASLLALSSPGFGIAVPVPKWKDALGRVMSRVWPSLAIPTGIDPGVVSRDAAVVAAYAADPKVSKVATARWYTEFLDAQARALAAANRITRPVLLLVAGADRVVSVAAEEKWFQAVASKDKTLIPYPECYHEIMNEPEREVVLGDLVRWLDARVGGSVAP